MRCASQCHDEAERNRWAAGLAWAVREAHRIACYGLPEEGVPTAALQIVALMSILNPTENQRQKGHGRGVEEMD